MKAQLLKIAFLLTLTTLSSCSIVPVGGRPMGPPMMGFNGMNQGPGAYPGVGSQGRLGPGRQKINRGTQGFFAQKMTNGKPDGPVEWISGASAPETVHGIRATVDEPEISMPSADLKDIRAKYSNNR